MSGISSTPSGIVSQVESGGEQGAQPAISLESLLQAHLGQIATLWQRAATAHAGIHALDEHALKHYRKDLPVSGKIPGLGAFHEASVVIPASIDWVLANATRDLLSILLIFLEGIRRFYEAAEIERSNLPAQEKELLLQQSLQRPPTPQDCINRLDSVLLGGFPGKAELFSMELIMKLFMARVSGQQLLESVTLSLCLAETKNPDELASEPLIAIGRIERIISSTSDLKPTGELLHQVFLTASIILRELAEAVHSTLQNRKSASWESNE
jgi:hypothetical protein